MTRKDYVLIAAAIKATRLRIAADQTVRIEECPAMQRGVRRAAAHICDALAKDNPRFDPATFLKACGYGAPVQQEPAITQLLDRGDSSDDREPVWTR